MGTFFNYEKLKKGFTGAVTVAAGAVSKGLEVAKDLAEDLTSFKALKDYKLAGTGFDKTHAVTVQVLLSHDCAV